MNPCFMITRKVGGGGNRPGTGISPLLVRRTGAIGDSLLSTVISDRLMDLGFEVGMQTHPHCHCVLKLHPRLSSLSEPNGFCHVNLDNAYEQHPQRRTRHYHSMMFERAQAQLKGKGIDLGSATNCRPRLGMPLNRREATGAKLSQHPQPWVMICPRSDSFNVRQIPDGVWAAAAPSIHGTKFWLGRHPAPPGIVDLNCRHFDSVIDYLSVADLMVSVETGPMHVAAALGIPILAIIQATDPAMTLNDQNDFLTISAGGLTCLHCQKTQCPVSVHLPPCQSIDPALVSDWANRRLHQVTTEDVSAVIAIYQPEVQTLNRCLESVLPQVQEIVVTAEGNSIIPPNSLKHPKIRYVQTQQRRIGVGRNFNHGVRHSNGKFVLVMNDDIILDPGAVDVMKLEMSEGVGAASHFLRYPSGRTYYSGKVRSPGVMGWGHLDHNQFHTTWKTPMDCENMCGASMLILRKAWFGVGGFDERFFCYSEDDALCLSLRKAGWKLRYTPHATGVHLEGQSTRKFGQPNELVNSANKIFDEVWGDYLRNNLRKVPGDFSYLS